MSLLMQLKARMDQGYCTHPFPKEEPILPSSYRGRPEIHSSQCESNCKEPCVKSCPTEALSLNKNKIQMDLGRCLFCMDCVESCPQGLIKFTRDYRLATSKREDLFIRENESTPKYNGYPLAQSLKKEMLRVFGRSLQLRQVSAGGCNGCEVEVNVLNTLVFDLSQFGIQFVASPRHADGILLTGPIPKNMEFAVQKTYDAIANPKLAIAVGACAISGGLFRDRQTLSGLEGMIPIDLYVPGCPPHPYTILDGLLRLLRKR